MTDVFLHGIQIEEVAGPPPPIATASASVIGLIGTSSKTAAAVPPNSPVLIDGSMAQAKEKFGSVDDKAKQVPKNNTIPYALAGILDQTAAQVVVVVVPFTGSGEATKVDLEPFKVAVEALASAESVVHATPRLLIAPGLLDTKEKRDEIISGADRLRGIAIVDLDDVSAAVSSDDHGGNTRAYFVSPGVKVVERDELASPRVAGVIARSDSERGFWASPSNQGISGISGTSSPVSFAMGDKLAKANKLNEAQVATIIHQDGYRLWGNRLSNGGFISVRRTQDIINDSLLRAHLWAVDRNITKTYLHDVTEGVNDFLRHLKSIGAIIDGRCFVNKELNQASQIVDGKATFDFEFTPPYPAEHITFRSVLVHKYLQELFA